MFFSLGGRMFFRFAQFFESGVINCYTCVSSYPAFRVGLRPIDGRKEHSRGPLAWDSAVVGSTA